MVPQCSYPGSLSQERVSVMVPSGWFPVYSPWKALQMGHAGFTRNSESTHSEQNECEHLRVLLRLIRSRQIAQSSELWHAVASGLLLFGRPSIVFCRSHFGRFSRRFRIVFKVEMGVLLPWREMRIKPERASQMWRHISKKTWHASWRTSASVVLLKCVLNPQ